MARPVKYTVDYFPHLCRKGKTLPILEARYGNNGYAFWFKLLEILATTDGHYFDASNPIQFEFLTAETRFMREDTPIILDLLATIGAIDADLWLNHKVIWCQNLVDNIADAYRNRKGLIPHKPSFLQGKLTQNIKIEQTSIGNLVSDTHNTQSKLKESKLNKSILSNDETSEKSVLEDLVELGKLSKKDPPEWQQWRKEIFAQLRDRRVYPLTKGQIAGEAKQMRWFFQNGYCPAQIIKAYDLMKAEPFWATKSLTLMSVAKQIGEVLQNGGNGKHPVNNQPKHKGYTIEELQRGSGVGKYGDRVV